MHVLQLSALWRILKYLQEDLTLRNCRKYTVNYLHSLHNHRLITKLPRKKSVIKDVKSSLAGHTKWLNKDWLSLAEKVPPHGKENLLYFVRSSKLKENFKFILSNPFIMKIRKVWEVLQSVQRHIVSKREKLESNMFWYLVHITMLPLT